MLDPSLHIDDLPLPDSCFDQDEPSHFEVNALIPLADLLSCMDTFSTYEDFYESIVLQPDSDFNIETAEMRVIGADPEADSVAVTISGRVF